jgi:hypothetical protein
MKAARGGSSWRLRMEGRSKLRVAMGRERGQETGSLQLGQVGMRCSVKS